MKNSHLESLRASAREAGNLAEWGTPIDGVVVYSNYTEDLPVSYCDSLRMKVGSQWVRVNWQHPRKVWLDRIEELAFDMASDEFPLDFDMEITPIYEQVGNSRKRVIAYHADFVEPNPAFLSRLEELKQVALHAANIEVTPSMHVEQHRDGRWVTLVCPVEIRSTAEALQFARQVREYLSTPGLFDLAYMGYSYTRVDYDAESAKQTGSISRNSH